MSKKIRITRVFEYEPDSSNYDHVIGQNPTIEKIMEYDKECVESGDMSIEDLYDSFEENDVITTWEVVE